LPAISATNFLCHDHSFRSSVKDIALSPPMLRPQ
jgi:hypothetical protein